MQPALQNDLFDVPLTGPDGFVYQPAFVSPSEESRLLHAMAALPLQETPYKEYTARRRTVSFGADYDPGNDESRTVGVMPGFLLPLREKFGAWAGIAPDAFVQALVSEYRPGTPLGWHRDMPDYESIVGLSLGAPCRMRFRPYRPGEKNRREEVLALDLMPRSAYQIRGPARWGWQHSVAPTEALRYSITFRTGRSR